MIGDLFKMVPRLRGKSYEDRLKDLKLPTLTYRRLRGNVMEVLKLVNDMWDYTSIVQICSQFTTNQKEFQDEIKRNCLST